MNDQSHNRYRMDARDSALTGGRPPDAGRMDEDDQSVRRQREVVDDGEQAQGFNSRPSRTRAADIWQRVSGVYAWAQKWCDAFFEPISTETFINPSSLIRACAGAERR